MASLQLNPMSAPNMPNPSVNPINNNWFPVGPQNTGLPLPPQGVINPFMAAPPAIPAGVPFNNSMGQMSLPSGQLFASPDASTQWAFNGSSSLGQSTGMTASSNLWQ